MFENLPEYIMCGIIIIIIVIISENVCGIVLWLSSEDMDINIIHNDIHDTIILYTMTYTIQ